MDEAKREGIARRFEQSRESRRRQRKHEWLDMSAAERAGWLIDTIASELGDDWRKLLVEIALDAGREAFANGNPTETAARKLYLMGGRK